MRAARRASSPTRSGARALGAVLRRGWRDQRGSASVEFVILLPLYLSIFASAYELGSHMTKQVMLDRATDLVVRDLRLGNFTNPDQDLLRDEICARTQLIDQCTANLLIEMTPVPTTTWEVLPNQTTCVDKAEEIEPVVAFNGGSSNDMMLIRVCAMVEPMFPTTGVGLRLPKVAGHYAIVATSAFVNEPGA
jgi:Flp pilus assembly protein TadG